MFPKCSSKQRKWKCLWSADWLLTALHVFQWGICGLGWLRMGKPLLSSCWASQVEKHKRRSSVFDTDLYRTISLSRTRGANALRSFCSVFTEGSFGDPEVSRRSWPGWLLSCVFTSALFNLHQGCRTPGSQRLLLLTALQSHESTAGWSRRSLEAPQLVLVLKHRWEGAERVFRLKTLAHL